MALHGWMRIAMMLLLSAAVSHAQDIEAKLAGNASTQGFNIKAANGTSVFRVRADGNAYLTERMGIGGILVPWAALHMGPDDGGIIAMGTLGQGATTLPSGAGIRMLWYPRKAAFRAGQAVGTEWNEASIGDFSIAMGTETKASGSAAIAFGEQCDALNDHTVAIGLRNNCTASSAIAVGGDNNVSGSLGSAIGRANTVSGSQAGAFGIDNTASAFDAIAIGNSCTASGFCSMALGTHATAAGNGTLTVCDNSTTTGVSCSVDNRCMMRFDQGYRIYTSSQNTTGMYANNGASSWSSVSDSTKKHGYRAADDERMLLSFRGLRLGSWSYLGRTDRHYGPMAQEWFTAFGRDGAGVVGDDTTLASADVDGVLCIAVKALEHRTAELRETAAQVRTLAERCDVQQRELMDLRIAVARLEAVLTERRAVAAPDSPAHADALVVVPAGGDAR
jgi:hypothetical protein